MSRQAVESFQKRQKNSMSWLDISVWINEQRKYVENSFIDNVYIYSKNLVVLKLRKSGENRPLYLVIEPGKRVSLSESGIDVEYSKNLSITWRSHIRDCRINSIEQYDRERIIMFKLSCEGTEKKLVIELLPRGTMILVDLADNVIIALEYRRMRDRVIVPKSKYVFPPKQWRESIDSSDFNNIIKNVKGGKQNIISYIIKTYGFPSEVVEAAFFICESSINSNKSLEEIIKCAINSVSNIIDAAIKNSDPCIIYANNEPIGFYPFIPPQFSGSTYRVEKYQSINEAINKYFIHDIENFIRKSRIEPIVSKIEKLKHTLQEMSSALKAYEDKKELLNKIVNIIERNYPEIETLHQCVQTVVKQLGWNSISKCSEKISSYDQAKGLYRIDVNGVSIELDVRKSLISIYNEYRKMLSDVDKGIERTVEEMNRIEKEIQRLSEETSLKEKSIKFVVSRKREWFEKFHWTITSSGFLILGGRDASQNIYLIKRFLHDNDIVMHADIHGGSAVIVKTNNRNIDEEALKEAAILAACYSKAWKMGLHSVNVFWVPGFQVSLSPPAGEYLPRGGFMVYGKKNYLNDVKLRLGIGLELTIDNENICNLRVVIGSENNVLRKSIAYMILEPGDLKIEEVVNEFLSELKKRGLEVVAMAIDLNELRTKIPGKSRIVKIAVNENAKEVLEKCLEHLM
ncbi:ribosome rescue protein RqcH [Ignisphaera sp. 4213-co]|uniref:Ribosome rescue protein RqcH n=1 Tax=Ignisphaera cupida TaxID=3050454 RepID=A0ABD4Z669_9CREN|nr:ribosome rescue protein RqcH [Ignisphaera sp. 4213-co]MDK6028249.1 ribosome rescue protein RqcH [Ignisphaera sp. 4213-co]